MRHVFLLSEINPLGVQRYHPLKQAADCKELLTWLNILIPYFVGLSVCCVSLGEIKLLFFWSEGLDVGCGFQVGTANKVDRIGDRRKDSIQTLSNRFRLTR